MKILVTGGSGFIGSAVCREIIRHTDHSLVNVDKLTYAASQEALAEIAEHPRYEFVRLDICDQTGLSALIEARDVDAILHLAAETHVDRSIDGPAAFIDTNIVGTYCVLEAARRHWERLADARRDRFRVVHVSTDEVFGSLGQTGRFTETTPYDPSSPYSASKAASDHLAAAWQRTYGLPVVTSNCSNNYGPYQFPEKLIPLMVTNALDGADLPVYGEGANVRDWLHVEDHARALLALLERGAPGRSYNVGGDGERSNLEVVHDICDLLDRLLPREGDESHRTLIRFVEDRPGHDYRYAMDASRLRDELDWRPREDFETGLARTVRWYLDNEAWWRPIRARIYKGDRLGLAGASGAAAERDT